MKFDKSQLLIYAVTDRAWTGKMSLYEQTEAALKGGATMVQLREKGLRDDNVEELSGRGEENARSHRKIQCSSPDR